MESVLFKGGVSDVCCGLQRDEQLQQQPMKFKSKHEQQQPDGGNMKEIFDLISKGRKSQC